MPVRKSSFGQMSKPILMIGVVMFIIVIGVIAYLYNKKKPEPSETTDDDEETTDSPTTSAPVATTAGPVQLPPDLKPILNNLLYGENGTFNAPVGGGLKNYIVSLKWAIGVPATKYSPAIHCIQGKTNPLTRDLTIGSTTTNYINEDTAYNVIVDTINAQNNLTGSNAYPKV